MSNASVISRLELALDRYERGELPASEVERAVGLHLPALERVRSAEADEAGLLAARLLNADPGFVPPSVEGQPLTVEGEEPAADVLRDFRAFLARLPR